MADDDHTTFLSRGELPELLGDAARIAGVDLGKRPTFGTAANVSGIRTRRHTFSRRRDSLTMFVTDADYGHRRRAGAWTGDEKRPVQVCRRVMRAARIPAAEIAGVDVLSEHGAVAERVSEREFRAHEPELLRRIARAHRAVESVPVWSSHVVVGLTRAGDVGQLELHWPRLSPEVVKEAAVLRRLVERGFEARIPQHARVESVEAGVLHSPPIGFYMDVVPAIRVVFAAGSRAAGGKKPTLYLDRHGELVALPRDIRATGPDQTERPAAGSTG